MTAYNPTEDPRVSRANKEPSEDPSEDPSEAAAIICALNRKGLSDHAIAAACASGSRPVSRETICRIRSGAYSGRQTLARLRDLAAVSLPAQYGPTVLHMPAWSAKPAQRAPRSRSGSATRAREYTQIFHDLRKSTAQRRKSTAQSAQPAQPTTQPTQAATRQRPHEDPAAQREAIYQELQARLAHMGIVTPAVQRDGRLDTTAQISHVQRTRRGLIHTPWCADCPFRPQAPVGTPEYDMQRQSFSCPHYAGRGCTREA